eukprot:scaffold3314_cov46-Skeletonema_menzelii.AAC.1
MRHHVGIFHHENSISIGGYLKFIDAAVGSVTTPVTSHEILPLQIIIIAVAIVISRLTAFFFFLLIAVAKEERSLFFGLVGR